MRKVDRKYWTFVKVLQKILKKYYHEEKSQKRFLKLSIILKIPFLCFLIIIVFFKYFLWNFYKSVEFSINFPHDVMTKNCYAFLTLSLKYFCDKTKKSLKRSYHYRKMLKGTFYLKKIFFIFLTNSQDISTWPQASSGHSKYWPLTLTFKIWPPWPTLRTKMGKQSIAHDCTV